MSTITIGIFETSDEAQWAMRGSSPAYAAARIAR